MHADLATFPRPAPAPLAATRFTAIVSSSKTRVGKTTLARALCDYLLLSERQPTIFDTDAAERKLTTFFPLDATVVDLDHVKDQMRLIDTLAAAHSEAQVVDLTQRSFGKFFDLLRETDYLDESRAHDARTVIFYIPGSDKASYEKGRRLRERFAECPFVLVKNEFLTRPSPAVLRSLDYRSLVNLQHSITMPKLDPRWAEAIDDQSWSLSGFMRRPLSLVECVPDDEESNPPLAKMAVRSWILAMFREIHRVTRTLHLRA